MPAPRFFCLTALTMLSWSVVTGVSGAGVSYIAPAGGWRYSYEGTFNPGVTDGGIALPPGYGLKNDTKALDGTWLHDQSDKWDGTSPGAPLSNPLDPIGPPSTATGGPLGTSPGGAGSYSEGGTDYIRIQDAGNPEYHGWLQADDPANTNRRVYFGRDLAQDFAEGEPFDQRVLDTGITISFRIRIPNSGPLDDLYVGTPDAPEVLPWIDPSVNPHGRGALLSNSRGSINVAQNNPSFFNQDNLIGFSLVTSHDIAAYAASGEGGSITTGSGRGGLIMNNLNGNAPTGQIDSTQPGQLNILEIDDADLNEWREFWITIKDNASAPGTHEVNVYLDGSIIPTTFNVTAAGPGNAAYANSQSAFLEFGISDNDLWGSFDLDFFSYQIGVIAPQPAPVANADFNADGVIDGSDFLSWQRGFGKWTGALRSDGDADGNGAVNAADLQVWRLTFGSASANSAIAAVPEPSSLSLAVVLAILGGIGLLRGQRLQLAVARS